MDRILRPYFAPIMGPVMITAAHVMAGGAGIALAKPHLAARVTREILKVDHATYQTPECRNVACGHAIKALELILPLLKARAPVFAFVRQQLGNSRPATRKKAERFLRQFGS